MLITFLLMNHQVGRKGYNVPEDTNVGRCLSIFGVVPSDTRDREGRERFHLFSPGWTLTYRALPSDWLPVRSIGFRDGDQCCAMDSVSFHYVKTPEHMRAYDAFLHGQCSTETINQGAP